MRNFRRVQTSYPITILVRSLDTLLRYLLACSTTMNIWDLMLLLRKKLVITLWTLRNLIQRRNLRRVETSFPQTILARRSVVGRACHIQRK